MSDDETYLDELEFYEQQFNHTPPGRKGVKRKHDARPERAIEEAGLSGPTGAAASWIMTYVPARFEALGLLGGVSRAALHAQLAAGLRVVLHLNRVGTIRSLDEVCVLDTGGPTVRAVPAWQRDAGPGPGAPELARLLAARGVPGPTVVSGQ